MKAVVHQAKKSVFEDWINQYLTKNGGTYIWPQITYDWNSVDILHIVFEKNSHNEKFIEWPATLKNVATTNIDFTCSPPELSDGSNWDFKTWHIKALQCGLANAPTKTPASFWGWRLDTRPQGNATCDLDFLGCTKDDKLIGIEATEIYFIDESKDNNKDVYEHFQRLFRFRKGGGFNIKQLQAQFNFMQGVEGRLFLAIHQIIKTATPYTLRDDKILLLEIDLEQIGSLKTIINSSDNAAGAKQRQEAMDKLKSKMHFGSMAQLMDRFF
jgi:hypothetical protein